MEKVLVQLSKDDITLHELAGESYHSFWTRRQTWWPSKPPLMTSVVKLHCWLLGRRALMCSKKDKLLNPFS